MLDQSLEIIAEERDSGARRKVIVDHTSMGVDQFYADEGKRMRELSLIKAEAHSLLRRCKANVQRMAVLEGGVMQDCAEADYEVRMHAQMVMEYDAWHSEGMADGRQRRGGSNAAY